MHFNLGLLDEQLILYDFCLGLGTFRHIGEVNVVLTFDLKYVIFVLVTIFMTAALVWFYLSFLSDPVLPTDDNSRQHLHNPNKLHGAESFLKSNSCSAGQEISFHFWNPKVHYRVHRSPPPAPDESFYFFYR
jgi:hypothetical protein